MQRSSLLVLMIALAALVACSAGCSKKAATGGPITTTPPPPPPEREPVETPAPETTPTTPGPVEVELEDVFFAFDEFSLRPDARQSLTENARLLKASPELSILIEGHCDERGTNEYNLALGDRRANAAREFLVRYGIDNARIETISFGEERPFDPGHTEAAWALNRRAHFEIKD